MRKNLLIYFSSMMLKSIANSDDEMSQILEGTGLSVGDLKRPSTRISFESLERLVKNAEDHWGRPDLGLHFGSQLSAIHFGVVGHAVATSENLREAIKVFLKYYKLRLRMLDFDVRQAEDELIVEIKHNIPDAALHRYYMDNAMAATKSLLSSILEDNDYKTTAQFAFDDGGYKKSYEAIFPDGVYFNADRYAINFKGLTGNEKLRFANEINSVAAQQLCKEELKLIGTKKSVATQVKGVIFTHKADPPKFPQVARDLGYSDRNLRRLLKEEGVNYRSLVTSVRSEHAAQLLKKGAMPVIEIAQNLGYDDYANFSRAFKKWFGISPAEYRRQNAS